MVVRFLKSCIHVVQQCVTSVIDIQVQVIVRVVFVVQKESRVCHIAVIEFTCVFIQIVFSGGLKGITYRGFSSCVVVFTVQVCLSVVGKAGYSCSSQLRNGKNSGRFLRMISNNRIRTSLFTYTNGIIQEILVSSISVSYTHLDVYKRQV